MLHENNINGPTPYCQVAIELEIEGVSSHVGQRLMGQVERTLGPEFVEAMSFISEHAELDVGHTRYNRGLLQKLLQDERVDLSALVKAGREALEIFGDYIVQCFRFGARGSVGFRIEDEPATKFAGKLSKFIEECKADGLDFDQLDSVHESRLRRDSWTESILREPKRPKDLARMTWDSGL